MLKPKCSVAIYYSKNCHEDFSEHEKASINFVAQRIAKLLACEFFGEYNDATHQTGGVKDNADETSFYFIPNDTLLRAEAENLGIQGPTQLFGGCVPHEFVAAKCITHPLIDNGSISPAGWSNDFPESVRHVTLRGFTAFSKADAMIAAEKLLPFGEVRIKAPLSRGGNGQSVVDSLHQASAFLQTVDDENFADHGVVLETNLQEETTRSVGTVTIGQTQISYCGSQVTTVNASGDSVYGGSTIRAVRGSFNNLLKLAWSKEEIIAIEQAMIYDFAADTCFNGFFASRRNYDVAQGFDRDNQFCSGVLEQSWRIGGASPAEIAAIEAFSQDPELISVRTSCREVHAICDVPDKSDIYFRGADADVGHITKFVTIDAYE